MSKYGKCDEGFPILEDFVCQAIPGSSTVPGFKVGDRVRDRSGSLGTILEIDTKANHGLGQVRVRFDDDREQIVALENGSLKKLEEPTSRS
jgi:hypothetical protein